MDDNSPYKFLDGIAKIKPKFGDVHVNFCSTCHYIWKAPSEATQCINCKNENTARSLVSYKTEAEIR